jgi:hypothetical protein
MRKMSQKKSDKTAPLKNLKEKRAAKAAKRNEKREDKVLVIPITGKKTSASE